MNNEEQEAIEFLKDLKNLEINYFADRFMTGKVYLQDSEKEQIDKVLNYISKLEEEIDTEKGYHSELQLRYNIEHEKYLNLQKENEELEEMLKTRISYTNELEQDLFENASNYVVSKDKLTELLQIDNIDVVHCKIKKLLEE